MTELGSGNGFICSRSVSMNSENRAPLNDPSTIDTNKNPSRDSAGRIEKLRIHQSMASEHLSSPECDFAPNLKTSIYKTILKTSVLALE